MNSELSIERTRSQDLLTDWRTQMSMSKDEAAKALSVDLEYYRELERGAVDLPLSLWRVCLAIAKNRDEPLVATSLPRDRWVRMVENSLAYLKNEHHISSLIKQRQWEEIADFMDFMRAGPHVDLAITDPHLFRKLREAGTRAALSGLLHFKGPPRPRPRPSSESTMEDSESAPAPKASPSQAFRGP